MTDAHTKQQRSYNMSRVRSKNTKPERIMFKLIEGKNLKFKKHYSIAGKPDIAFPKLKLAIFIDGEFWHGRKFKEWSNKLSPFWYKKISENITRDRKNHRHLRGEGWRVMRLWDKRILRDPEKALSRIMKFIERIQKEKNNQY